jgi:hypothetical protein
MAEVVVDGLRVRGRPSVTEGSAKFDQLLSTNDQFFIVDGPVAADGYEWYLGQALLGGQARGPFGWVAAASRDGQAWIDDVDDRPCPTLPDDARAFGVLPVEVLVHCFGSSELSFELGANVYCLADGVRVVEPAWFGSGCGELSGDACGGCDLPIAADPVSGVKIPDQEHARWSFTGHFDDPAALTCHAPTPAAGDSIAPEDYAIHLCRMTFVLTDLTRLGDAE